MELTRQPFNTVVKMDASQAVKQSAQEVIATPPASLADAVNIFVGTFVGWPFTAAPGFVVDDDGNRSDAFACVIHTTPTRKDGAGGFPADGVVAVIDASENLGLKDLRAAYARIAHAKRLKKRPTPRVPGAPPPTTVTLGIMLAQRSDLPLETLGEELDRLNAVTPGRERPDMLVVASTGVINYGVQFPGESVTGDFLPPGEGALEAYTPPMYIVMVMRPSGDFSLNKMMAFRRRSHGPLTDAQIPGAHGACGDTTRGPPAGRSGEVPTDAGQRRNAALGYLVSRFILRRIVISRGCRDENRFERLRSARPRRGSRLAGWSSDLCPSLCPNECLPSTNTVTYEGTPRDILPELNR